jgi:hypothetical protein
MQEFPYLTTTEAVDVQAGVRFCTRYCFILETISIDIKPKIRTARPGYDVLLRDEFLATAAWERENLRWLTGENSSQEIVMLHSELGSYIKTR